jgi:outer membrane protein assembly factor BamB/plastocyanin
MNCVHVRRAPMFGALIAMSLVVAACGSGSKTSTTSPPKAASTPSALSSSWELPGANAQNTRDVGGPINASNVSTLGVAWTLPIQASGTYGSYSATPVVSNGVLYTQDLASNVYAVNLASGKVIWIKKYSSPDAGPNGVAVANGIVYGATEESAFALQASNGAQLWIRKLVRNGSEGIDQAPGYHDGTLYLSTVPGNTKSFYSGNGQGILWALSAETGEPKWNFETVPANLWSSAHTKINSGGGLWNPPTFDSQGNLYIGTGNPGPWLGTKRFPWAQSRPGPNLYTDSIVKLNGATGKVMWYYQLTPHDLLDYDLEDSPILASDHGTPIVIDGGKAGILVAVNQETGKLVWKRPVGVHNGKDEVNLAAEKGDYSKLKLPLTVEPGDLGGIESSLASNGNTVFAAVNNLAVKYKGQTGLPEGELIGGVGAGTGDLVAISEASGEVEWDDKLPSSPYGAATLANNVVFTTTFNGTLYAFEASTGKELWKTTLSAATNAPVAVVGDTVITAGSFPQAAGQKALITAYRLGATGKLPAATTAAPPAKTTTTTTTKATPAAPAAASVIKSEADSAGLLKYTASQIRAKAGDDTVTFTNNSPLEHNMVLINAANKILGQTPIFDHGTKSFKVKLAPGTYTYYCSVPGHRGAGMQGTLTIK